MTEYFIIFNVIFLCDYILRAIIFIELIIFFVTSYD